MTDADPEPREVIVHMTEAHFEHYRAWLATQPDTTIDVVGEAWADRGEFAYRVSKADEDTVRWWCDTCGRKGEVTLARPFIMSVPLDVLRAEHGEPIAGHSLHTEWINPASPLDRLRPRED